ncbi:MAG: PKD domain-containing protein [Thermoplasmata archaeon]|nr:PKD domain-containing protein [Thermoplasmata archaeon]
MSSFAATLPTPMVAPRFSWQFGDGTFWNGTGLQYGSVSHLYERPGHFQVGMTATVGSLSYLCSVNITVGSQSVVPSIRASILTGPVPLSVDLSATAVGGSGTYKRFNWSFGDGSFGTGVDVAHTFRTAGDFEVLLNVTDSNGSTGEASLEISATPSGGSPITPLRILTEAAPWVLSSLAISLAIVLVIVLRRSPRNRAPPGPPSASLLSEPTKQSDIDEGPSKEVSPMLAPAAPVSPSPELGVPRSSPSTEVIRVSQRIVLHLAAQGALRPDDVARVGFSQAGIQAAVGVSRSSASNALRRLESSGILQSEVRHVEGGTRRLRVYILTDRGWTLSRELRSRLSSRAAI